MRAASGQFDLERSEQLLNLLVTMARNRLVNLNTSRCDSCVYLADEPDMLRSGIYLGRRAERPAPARGNIVEDNQVSGYKMASRCVNAAPGLTGNIVRNNVCRDYQE